MHYILVFSFLVLSWVPQSSCASTLNQAVSDEEIIFKATVRTGKRASPSRFKKLLKARQNRSIHDDRFRLSNLSSVSLEELESDIRGIDNAISDLYARSDLKTDFKEAQISEKIALRESLVKSLKLKYPKVTIPPVPESIFEDKGEEKENSQKKSKKKLTAINKARPKKSAVELLVDNTQIDPGFLMELGGCKPIQLSKNAEKQQSKILSNSKKVPGMGIQFWIMSQGYVSGQGRNKPKMMSLRGVLLHLKDESLSNAGNFLSGKKLSYFLDPENTDLFKKCASALFFEAMIGEMNDGLMEDSGATDSVHAKKMILNISDVRPGRDTLASYMLKSLFELEHYFPKPSFFGSKVRSINWWSNSISLLKPKALKKEGFRKVEDSTYYELPFGSQEVHNHDHSSESSVVVSAPVVIPSTTTSTTTSSTTNTTAAPLSLAPLPAPVDIGMIQMLMAMNAQLVSSNAKLIQSNNSLTTHLFEHDKTDHKETSE